MIINDDGHLRYINRNNVVFVTTSGYSVTVHTVCSKTCDIKFGYKGCGYDKDRLAILFLYYFSVAETIDTNPEIWLKSLVDYIIKRGSVEIGGALDIWKNQLSGNLFGEIYGKEIKIVDDKEYDNTLLNHLKEAIKG